MTQTEPLLAGQRAVFGNTRHRERDARVLKLRRASFIAMIWITSLLVVAFWVSGGGIQALFGGGANAITTLGRLTGLVASNLLLYQVLLMARIPAFERAFGQDTLTTWHRWVGFTSFWMFLAHIVLIVYGYAATAVANPLATLWDMIWNYPGMLLATVGTIALIVVVALSIRAARRTLRYESWHLIHLYAYFGVGLALPHQLWTGADFISSPFATTYWWTLWAVSAGAVLLYRVIVPLTRSSAHRLRVASVKPAGADTVTIRMAGHQLQRLHARGGQFFQWRFLDGPGWSRAHPFSLSSAPTKNEFAITVRTIGDGTRRLRRLKPGTRVMFEGPYGRLTDEARTRPKVMLLGAGVGITPLLATLEEQRYRPGEAILVTRDRDEAAEVLRDRVRRICHERGVQHYRLLGHRQHDESWLPNTVGTISGPDAIRRIAPDFEDYDFFICGPGVWMSAVKHDLEALGVDRSAIHIENFSI